MELEARLAAAKPLEEERSQGIGKEGVGAKLLRDEVVAEDIADVILFLASHQARYLTGQVIVADGGLAISPQ